MSIQESNTTSKRVLREMISLDVEVYLASGGKITACPATADKGGCSRWSSVSLLKQQVGF